MRWGPTQNASAQREAEASPPRLIAVEPPQRDMTTRRQTLVARVCNRGTLAVAPGVPERFRDGDGERRVGEGREDDNRATLRGARLPQSG